MINSRKIAGAIGLFIILLAALPQISHGLQTSNIISSTGTITYYPQITISVNPDNIIGINNLSLGFHLDWGHWKTFVDRPIQRQLAQNASLSLVRVFDFRKTAQYGIPNLMPCTSWNEATKTGTWDWTYIDLLTQSIFSISAEPLFCLGWAYNVGDIQRFLPSGMDINPVTGLPYPESYAAYAKEWVKHFKTLNWPVRYYEILNEPHFYFGWNPSELTKLGYYVSLWNTVAAAMRAENPAVLLSQDAINFKWVFNYWLQYGADVDFLDFHKYDAEYIGQYSDAEMLSRAERIHIETTTTYYGIEEARQRWFNARGKTLPVICSESNFNCAWDGGTDPKIQQMIGAVWQALALRMYVLKGLSYNIYFEFSSPKSTAAGEGWGFGMVNLDDNTPWYPYYVQKMLGSNLATEDRLVEVQTSSNDVRSIAWIHGGKLNILLICKVDESRVATLQGINGQVDVFWIDNVTGYENPSIQTSTISSANPLIMNGYTVALLQVTAT